MSWIWIYEEVFYIVYGVFIGWDMRFIINFCFRLLGFEGGCLWMDECIDVVMLDMDFVFFFV